MPSPERVILHLDMDAFFASVEEVCHPRLRGKPLIVCGDPRGRSVVSTASYAAREFGIKSGMPVAEARRRCPHAIFWTGDPAKYVHLSLRILDCLKEVTSQVEPFSIDEAFLELTGQVASIEEAAEVAGRIRAEIKNRFGLTATIGISRNKLLAKMASSLAKPDGLRVLLPEEAPAVLGPLPASALWGIGEKTSRALEKLGIRTVSDLAAYPPLRLRRVFGVVGEAMVAMARGVDHTPLVPYYDGISEKSMGHEHTLSRNLLLGDELRHVLLRLSDQVARRLRGGSVRGRRITVKIRFADMKTITRQRTLEEETDREEVIYHAARGLLDAHAGGGEVRLIGVSVAGLAPRPAPPQAFIFDEDRKRGEAAHTVDGIRDRYGDDAITRAAVLAVRRRRRHPSFTFPSFHPPASARTPG